MPRVGNRHIDVGSIKPQQVKKLPNDAFKALVERVIMLQQADRKECNLLYYKPVSKQAEKVHLAETKYVGISGGNGAGKTEHALAHLAMMATGVIPEGLSYLKKEFRGPINVRVVCESLTTVLHPIILPKLQWWKWTGQSPIGGDKGHWGWIPKLCLVDASWERAWSEKLRLLRVICRDPDNFDKVLGESLFQFMSSDNDPADFASGDYHYVLHDEPPTLAIWTENEARTMRVDGRMFLSMTWPDDPAIAVDWIFDDMYEKGRAGPNKSPHHEWIEIYTTDNEHLNQEAVALQMDNWSEEMKNVRIYGQPITFSNRIHPLYTDISRSWCYNCQKTVVAQAKRCPVCHSEDVNEFLHFTEFEVSQTWPCIWVLDPHPRKPHMFLWAQIDPSDDIWVVAEGQVEGDPSEVRERVEMIESSLGLHTVERIMDPNMGLSPASSKRGVTWQSEFSDAGLECDLADDSDVGRGRINEFLRPDPYRLQPRMHIHPRCQVTNFQMKRYTWDEHKKGLERDIKQKPRPKYDDFPTCLKYLMNRNPQFSWLREGAPVIHRPGKRKGAY